MEVAAGLVFLCSLLISTATAADQKPLACVKDSVRIKVGSETKCYVMNYDMVGSFQDAVNTCWNQYRAFPISLDTEEEIEAVVGFILTHKPVYLYDDHGGTWIGAIKVNNTWRWFPGDKVVTNHKWEPLMGDGGDFGLIRLSEASLEWDSVSALFKGSRLRYLCELQQCPRGCHCGTCDSSFSCNCEGTKHHGELCELEASSDVPPLEQEELDPMLPPYNQHMGVEVERVGPELTATLFMNCVLVVVLILALCFLVYGLKLFYEYGKSSG